MNELFVYRMNYALSLILVLLVFYDKRTFGRRARIGLGILVLVDILISVVVDIPHIEPESLPNDLGTYYLLSVPIILFVFLCIKASIKRKLYFIITIMMMRQISRFISQLVIHNVDLTQSSFAAEAITFLSMCLVCIGTRLLFGKRVAVDNSFEPTYAQSLVIGAVATLLFYGAYLEPVLLGLDKRWYNYYCFVEIINCLALLWIQYVGYSRAKALMDYRYENELQSARISQYQQIQDIIKDINIKNHDLKHQIQELESKGCVEQAVIDDMKSSLNKYDSFVNTGNEILDAVLTQKSIQCQKTGISLLCMLSGRDFDLFSAAEVRSLFGNAIDNAIEYLVRSDFSDKYIKIREFKQENAYKLTIENPCTEEISVNENGTLNSTKEEQFAHGFGTKSIKNIVERHNGVVKFYSSDGVFKLEMMFFNR